MMSYNAGPSMHSLYSVFHHLLLQGLSEDSGGGGRLMMDSKLTDEQKMECAKVVQGYLAGRVKDPIMAGKFVLFV